MGNIALSNKGFNIAETDTFIKKIEKREYRKIYIKIREYIYPQLRNNPYFGPNIKKLKGEYSDLYQYGIGNYRLFYEISEDEVIIYILEIENRKDSYK